MSSEVLTIGALATVCQFEGCNIPYDLNIFVCHLYCIC